MREMCLLWPHRIVITRRTARFMLEWMVCKHSQPFLCQDIFLLCRSQRNSQPETQQTCNADPIQILLLIFFTMQTVDKLYTNSTNRLPILPQPVLNFPLRSSNQPLSFTPTPNPKLQTLFTMRLSLQHQLTEAKQQQQMMQQLFDSLAKAERGEVKFQKKMKRRCNKDILDRFYCTQDNCKRCYSSQTSLQRHVKIKHGSGRKVPPQLFRDLPPEPNLTEQDSEEESHCCLEMKGGETTNNRELT